MGNVRLSYQDADNSGSISMDEIVEESNYYPFELKHRGYGPATSSLGNSVAQRWKYNGKEYDESLDINTYDFGARNYDPALGRWMNVDPVSDLMKRVSPYNYTFNNPIKFIDPNGMFPADPPGFIGRRSIVSLCSLFSGEGGILRPFFATCATKRH